MLVSAMNTGLLLLLASLVTVSGGELPRAGAGPGAAVGGRAGLQLRPGPSQHRHGAGHGGDTRAVRDTDTRNSVMQGAGSVFCIHLPIAPLPSDLTWSAHVRLEVVLVSAVSAGLSTAAADTCTLCCHPAASPHHPAA